MPLLYKALDWAILAVLVFVAGFLCAAIGGLIEISR